MNECVLVKFSFIWDATALKSTQIFSHEDLCMNSLGADMQMQPDNLNITHAFLNA